MTFRTVLSTSFFLLLVSSAFGQEGMQTPQSAKPFTLTQVWTFDATYNDKRHGVAFRYPSVWKPANQFGYHPPALTQLQDGQIAGFGYEEGGFPRGPVPNGPYSATNLEGFGVVYSAVATADAAECESKASSLSLTPKHRVVTLHGRSFIEHETGEGGMSQSISGKLYATYVRPTCYLFETDVAEASIGALEDISALTPAQRQFIDTHLFDIMKSVRIVPPERSQD